MQSLLVRLRSKSGTILLVLAAGVSFAGSLFVWRVRLYDGVADKIQQRTSRAGGALCEEAVWDFGTANVSDDSATISHTFTLTNEVEKDIEIREVRTSCGCMVVDGYDAVLSPGQSTELAVNVTLPPTTGFFEKTLAVAVDGVSSGWLPLRVVGKIASTKRFGAAPAVVNFGELRQGEIKKRTVTILRFDHSHITRLSASASDENITCELLSASAGNTPQVRCTFDSAHVRWGAYSASIVIRNENGNGGKTVLTVPVSALIVRPESVAAVTID